MAGSDTSTLLPKDSIVLSGAASYNPTGGLLSYKWSQVAGPSAAVFINDTLARPLVKNLVLGSYQLKLTVTNTQGHSSEDLLVLVVSPVPVFPPVANAGGTTTITLPVNSSPLTAAASTNSAGGVLRYTWIKISGPASFSISGDTTVTPFISSLTEGSYQIKLTLTNNNGLSASDTATVVVKPAPVPVANAGADKHIVLPLTATPLDGSASTTAGVGTLSYAWSKVSGPPSFSITGDSSAIASVSNLTEGVYQVKLTVTNSAGITASDFVNITVAAAPVAIANAGADINIVLPNNFTLLNGTASYSTGGGAISYEWSMISGAATASLGGASTATPSLSNLEAGIYQFRLKVTDQQGLSATDTVAVTVTAQPVYPPVSNAGPDIAITQPSSSVQLNGDQSFNPAGGILTYSWSLISGPASFAISGAGSATPTISSLTEGAYQLQLLVTNQQGISSHDEVTVTVSPAPPAPPVANAGSDITITMPVNTVNLDGSGSFNAAGGTLIYSWTQASGPAAAAIGTPNAAATGLGNLVQGNYHIKLMVTNAQGLAAEDIVSITVLPAPLPVAAAGVAVAIVLPANTVTLNGSASYDPAGGTVSYYWSKIAGPPAFSLAGNTTATPTFSNLTAGIYTIQLTVTNNGGSTATDIVTVTVNLPSAPVPVAGNDTTIQFPGGHALLNGSKSYGAGGALISTYHWQQVAGPTTALINDPKASQASAVNLEPGTYTFQLTVTDNYGQKTTALLKVTVVRNVANLRSITLYPNPCTNTLHVRAVSDSTGKLLVRITNLFGIVLQQQVFTKTQLIFDEPVNVANLPAGMYVLEAIIGGNTQLLSKFVKN
jgi:PKD repeat protein